MNETTQALIERSLQSRSIDDTYALFKGIFTPEVRKQQIIDIRKDMVARGIVEVRMYGPNHYQNAEALPSYEGQERAAKAEGCAKLLKAQLRTGQYCGSQRAVWLDRHGEAA